MFLDMIHPFGLTCSRYCFVYPPNHKLLFSNIDCHQTIDTHQIHSLQILDDSSKLPYPQICPPSVAYYVIDLDEFLMTVLEQIFSFFHLRLHCISHWVKNLFSAFDIFQYRFEAKAPGMVGKLKNKGMRNNT